MFIFSMLFTSITTSVAWVASPSKTEFQPLGNSIEDWKIIEEKKLKEDNAKPTDQMIGEAGYPAETHMVVTEDGYLLRLHRIPHGRQELGYQRNVTRPVVFLQHGLLSSSADWVVTGPDHALAFLLADRGYDVWMGNYRGNTYSQGHVSPSLPPGEYWDFTWDEMSQYDLPAMLKHVIKIT